jgi:8-oxo-dGTP pyrophosphatase MutT (NUDIX family)
MEQRLFLSPRQHGNESVKLGRDIIVRRFAERSHSRASRSREGSRAGSVEHDVLEAARGDQDLNPGMVPIPPIKDAAVLIPLIDRPEGMTVLLTQRTAHLANHAGQVSFPGGRADLADAGFEETALRETQEEIGLDRSHVRILGRLDTYVTRTGFAITPVVGVIEPPFPLTPDPFEVAEVFEVPLSFLLDPNNHRLCSHEFEGKVRYFYAMPYGRHYIWGATAGILMNLYEFLSDR